MLTSSFRVSGAPAPPIRVGIARVADRLSVAVLSGCGSGVIGAGLDSMHVLGMLHWNAALILAGSSRVIGWRGAPAGVAVTGRSAASARRLRRFWADQSGRRRRREAGFAGG